MAVSTINGWTGSSLLPSYALASRVLGPAAQPQTANAGGPVSSVPSAQSPTVAPQRMAGPGAGLFPGFLGMGGLPSVPQQAGSGWGSPGGFDPNSGMGSDRNPVLTPEQAYAKYLTNRSYADTTTPAENYLTRLNAMHYNPVASDPGFGTLAGAQNYSAFDAQQKNQAMLLNQLILGAAGHPQYSLSYGAPAANAPAQAPAWGYPSGYGQSPPGPRSSGWSAPTASYANTPGYGFG